MQGPSGPAWADRGLFGIGTGGFRGGDFEGERSVMVFFISYWLVVSIGI